MILIFQRINRLGIIFGSGRNQLVHGSDIMTRSHFTRIFPVVVEILLIQQPVFISYQPVRLNFCRIELNLELDIPGDCEQSASEFLYKNSPSLLKIIYV